MILHPANWTVFTRFPHTGRGSISGPPGDSSAVPVNIGEHCSVGVLRHLWPATPGQHSQFLFRKLSNVPKIRETFPGTFGLRWQSSWRWGSRRGRRKRPGLQPGAMGLQPCQGDSCFQKGREPWVPGRERLPAMEGKLELTHRKTDRQATDKQTKHPHSFVFLQVQS